MTKQEVLAQIRMALAEIKVPGADQAELETTWSELEVDSLDLVEIVRMLEDHYDFEVPDDRLEGVNCVGDAVSLVVCLVGSDRANDSFT